MKYLQGVVCAAVRAEVSLGPTKRASDLELLASVAFVRHVHILLFTLGVYDGKSPELLYPAFEYLFNPESLSDQRTYHYRYMMGYLHHSNLTCRYVVALDSESFGGKSNLATLTFDRMVSLHIDMCSALHAKSITT